MKVTLYFCADLIEVCKFCVHAGNSFISMKRFFLLLLLVCLGATLSLSAQSAADKIVGVYRVVKDGRNSKVKVFKHAGGYRAQVIWLENMKNPDGSQRTDTKNPDPAKRHTPSNQIVLVDKVTYDADDNEWEDGRIYDPTSGKTYKVEMYFEKPGVLTVKGKLGPFYKKMYWTKIQ